MYIHVYIHMYIYIRIHIYMSEFFNCFEPWAKLTQKWLVCAPLEIHLEPSKKESMLLVTV